MAKEIKKKHKTKKTKNTKKVKKTKKSKQTSKAKKRRWFSRKKKEIEEIPDHRIDLDEIIKVDSFALNNIYDPKTVLYILNKKNKLHLTMDDVVFDTFDEHKARLRAKNIKKYKGVKTIYYEQAKNIGYIVWLIISMFIFLVGMAVLLPVGLVGNANADWQRAGQIILIISAPVCGVGFISILICVLCWRGEISVGKLQSVESKAELAQVEDEEEQLSDAQVQVVVEDTVEKEIIKKTP